MLPTISSLNRANIARGKPARHEMAHKEICRFGGSISFIRPFGQGGALACSGLSAIQLLVWKRTLPNATVKFIVSLDRWEVLESGKTGWMAADTSPCFHPMKCPTGQLDKQQYKFLLLRFCYKLILMYFEIK